MGNNPIYGRKFFAGIQEGSYRSAIKIIPLLKALIQIRSVVDVGCGTGSWLKAFQENGVKDILGIDSNPTDVLEIPAGSFFQTDLSLPFGLERRFDLVVCLEVAEHLPANRADSLVENLTSLSPVILFSAAVPGQGGTHHVNEQWPEYWSEKFKLKGYLALDCLRMKIWTDPEVMWWYSQNTLLYVRKDVVKKNVKLSKLPVADPPPRLIHPEGLTIIAQLRRIRMRLWQKMGF